MFHLLLTVCTAQPVCAEHWLPAEDAPSRGVCEAAAADAGSDWASRRGLTVADSRCVPTGELPLLTLEPVAPGVWVHRGDDAEASPGNGGAIANLGVIEGPDGVVVIDAGGNRTEGERLLAAVLHRTSKPVVAAILTHAHPDHSLGAEVFAEAGATVIAHHRLPEALAARIGTYAMTWRDSIGETAWLASEFLVPETTVETSETRWLGGTQLLLVPEGRAHSDADLTVFHPDSGTLFTGDLLFRRLTPVLEGSIGGWLDWLSGEPLPAPRTIVPGHGPVAQIWPEASGATQSYLQALADAVRAALAHDLALSDAIGAILSDMRAQAADWSAGFDGTTRRNAAAAFAEIEWE